MFSQDRNFETYFGPLVVGREPVYEQCMIFVSAWSRGQVINPYRLGTAQRTLSSCTTRMGPTQWVHNDGFGIRITGSKARVHCAYRAPGGNIPTYLAITTQLKPGKVIENMSHRSGFPFGHDCLTHLRHSAHETGTLPGFRLCLVSPSPPVPACGSLSLFLRGAMVCSCSVIVFYAWMLRNCRPCNITSGVYTRFGPFA